MHRSALALAAVLAALPAAAGTRSFGKPLAGLAPSTLQAVLAKPEAGKAVRLEGTVDAVCRNKGCWLELKQGEQSVHVTFAGYSFFVPKDVVGRPVALEGRVVVRRPPAGEVEHLQSEGASEAAGAGVSIEATGVEVR